MADTIDDNTSGGDDDGSTTPTGSDNPFNDSGSYDGGNGDGGFFSVGGRKQTLTRFVDSPTGFILGAILAPLLNGAESVLATILDGITLLFVGAEPGTDGLLGIADIPLLIGEIAVDAGRALGGRAGTGVAESSGLLGAAANIVDTAIAASELAGPFAPVVLAGEVVLFGYLTVVGAQRLVGVALDFIPGAGGLT